MSTLEIISLLELATRAASNAGVNVARFNELRNQNEDGHLTADQRAELAQEAKDAVSQM